MEAIDDDQSPRDRTGITDYDPPRKDRLARLDALKTGDGRPLPKRLKTEIRRELDRVDGHSAARSGRLLGMAPYRLQSLPEAVLPGRAG